MGRLSSLVAGVSAALFVAGAAFAGPVEVKGPHICCGQCVKVAVGLVSKVDGVSEAKADAKAKTVTFTAKDDAAAEAGVKALFEGGFYGKATHDGKDIKIKTGAPKKGEKADAVTVKGVHMCCGQCRTAAKKLFPDAKVSFEGPGPQQDVRVEAAGLDPRVVLDTLRKSGFNGTVAK